MESFNTLSDAGYTTGGQLEAYKKSGICTYSSPMPSTSPNTSSIALSEFHYAKDDDSYIYQSGARMTTNCRWIHQPNYKSKVYKTPACENFSIRGKCTQNPKGRIIERSEYQNTIDENNARVLANKDY